MAKVLVLGGGAREHALAYRFSQSPSVAAVNILPGNSAEFSLGSVVDHTSVDAVKDYCKINGIDLVAIGPEQYISEGWADVLSEVTKVFAPSKAAAELEASKSFAKEFMVRHSIPTAKFHKLTNQSEAVCKLNSCDDWAGYVVKEDGLCAGKGVTVHKTKNEAAEQLQKIYSKNGSAVVVLEEFLSGFEVSALCFTDGSTVKTMPLSQDHKAAWDGDQGPNTGGMGAVAPITLTQKVEQQIESILQKSVDGMKKDGRVYKGVLYAGLMITNDGPKVLEYNCRFGDPETQVCVACCEKRLSDLDLRFSAKRSACVVLASKGYPGQFERNIPISNVDLDDVFVFHAGMKRTDGGLESSGGRVLTIAAVAHTFQEALSKCYNNIDKVHFSNGFYRRDIGHFVVNSRPLHYADSGVNIAEGNRLVDEIKGLCARTRILGTEQIGGFGALVDIEAMGYRNPSLVIGMDGVGTKLELANEAQQFDNLGFDLVGMCVNDVICHGASPVAFLDYYVTGKLDKNVAKRVIAGIAAACQESGCALVGGETAEMPGVYGPEQWDLAGCCVGIKENTTPHLPLTTEMEAGDVLIGLASNGVHSNGFSLVRKILGQANASVHDVCPWDSALSLGQELLKPTRLYAKSLLELARDGLIKGAAHITGGGLYENVPRILPKHLAAEIDCKSWTVPEVFKWLQKEGPVQPAEMFTTFNCGLGMVLVVSPANVSHVMDKLSALNTTAWLIGNLASKLSESVVLQNMTVPFITCPLGDLQRKRVNVGSNMVRLIQQSQHGHSNCTVSLVVSNKPDAAGLEKARELGVKSVVVPHGNDRLDFENRVTQMLHEHGVELVCLAGFMRILTAQFLGQWPRRVINLHPSLLPAFKGANAVEQALASGVKYTGCSAHFVVEDVDAGQILEQEVVPVATDDDQHSLHAKIQQREHVMFPRVMEKVALQVLQKQI